MVSRIPLVVLPWPARGFRRAVMVLAFTLGTGAGPATGQAVAGVVVDETRRRPVPSALVTLLDSAGAEVFRGETNTEGEFFLRPGAPGMHGIQVEALGYFASDPLPFEYTGESVFLAVRLTPAPMMQSPLEIMVEAQKPALRNVGYYDRRDTRPGVFLDPAEIEARRNTAQSAADFLRRSPGISVSENGEPYSVRSGRGLGELCAPTLIVDRVLVRAGGVLLQPLNRERFIAGSPTGFSERVPPPQRVEAMEFYHGAAGMPAEFAGVNSSCGVLVIWTRR